MAPKKPIDQKDSKIKIKATLNLQGNQIPNPQHKQIKTIKIEDLKQKKPLPNWKNKAP